MDQRPDFYDNQGNQPYGGPTQGNWMPAVWVEGGVVPAVEVSSVVAQPHVVASIGEDVAESLAWCRNDPIRRAAEQAVLHKDGRARTFQILVGQPMWNPVQSQDVIVRRCHPVFLRRVTIRTDQFRRAKVVL